MPKFLCKVCFMEKWVNSSDVGEEVGQHGVEHECVDCGRLEGVCKDCIDNAVEREMLRRMGSR